MTNLDRYKRAPHGGYNLQRKLLAATVAACFGTAHANPTLPQVVAGQATFAQQGNVFSITNTPNTIINWQSFSVGRDEITRFIQQSSDSKVLNRITGQDPSQILGSLQSNGQVFLINPNGVLFGKDARVDVQGLVASSLGLSNADFLAGRHNYAAESAGKVINQGSITTPQGGKVYLIAPTVENHGVISAPNGEILLAAGKSVQLVDSANPAITVVVSAPDDQALNLGQVVAQGGRVGIYGALVNQRGVVNADSAVRGENGKIVLKASGRTTLDAGSRTTAGGAGKGGEIQILGRQVALNGDAAVDASGQQGGGTVLVGGDYQGKNSDVQNAQQTFIGRNASIKADALQDGDGGKVIVWADESAQAYGRISARGAGAGGKGGFVETSGLYLDVAGIKVDTRGELGNGNWLLDPYNIEVVSVAYGGYGLDDVNTFAGGLGGDTTTSIAASDINSANTNVLLLAKNNITFTANVSISQPDVSLTAKAGNTIYVNGSLESYGGAINLLAANAEAGATLNTAGSVTIGSGGSIHSQGGDVTLRGGNVTVGGVVSAGEGNLYVTATKAGGAVTVSAAGSLASTGYDTDVEITADNLTLLNVEGSLLNADGRVRIYTQTASRDAKFGVKDAAALSLDGDELARVHASEFGFGSSAHTGTVKVTGSDLDLSHLDSFVLNTAGDMVLDKGLRVGDGEVGSILLHNFGAGKSITLASTTGNGLEGQYVSIAADKVELTKPVSGDHAISAYRTEFNTATATQAITLGGTGANTTAFLTRTELATVSAPVVEIGTRTTYNGDVTVTGALDLSGTQAGTQEGWGILEIGGKNIAINGALKTSDGLRLDAKGTLTQTSAGTITAPSLYARGSSVTLGSNNTVSELEGESTSGAFTFKTTGNLTLGTEGNYSVLTEEGPPEDEKAIRSAGDVTLTANNISQYAGIEANKLTLAATGDVDLTAYNEISELSASLRSLHLHNEGDLKLTSVVQTGKTVDEGIQVNNYGVLSVGALDSKGSLIQLSADEVKLLGGGTIKGGSVMLEGSKVSLLGSSAITATSVGIYTNNLDVQGTIKASADSEGYGGQVSIFSENNVRLGGTLSDGEGTLVLNNAELGRITAHTVFVDTSGYESSGESVTFDNLTIGNASTSPIGSLHVIGDSFSFLGTQHQLPKTQLMLEKLEGSFLLAEAGSSSSSITLLAPADFKAITAAALTLRAADNITVSTSEPLTLSNLGKLGLEAGGQVAINSVINAPAKALALQGSAITVGGSGSVKAAMVTFAPYYSNWDVSVGAACTGDCLSLTELYKYDAPVIGIGSNDYGNAVNQIVVHGIGTAAGETKRHDNTTTIGLITGASEVNSITQTGAIEVANLGVDAAGDVALTHTGNDVHSLALWSGGGISSFTNSGALVVDRLTGGSVASGTDYDLNGINVAGALILTVGGALTTAPVTTGKPDVAITAGSINMNVNGAIGGAATAPLMTKTALLNAHSSASSGTHNINIKNTSPTSAGAVIGHVFNDAGNNGSITIENVGPTNVDGIITSHGGAISITARSPLTVLPTSVITSNGGAIRLEAGSSGSVNDKLNIASGAVVAAGTGTVTLRAGNTVTVAAGTVTGSSVTTQQNLNPPPVVSPPPVNPPPVNPPPVNPPPVNPPPVNPPPVNPPPVNPPPVNPPPVNPPPVNPPPVNPPPVNPPPSADICTIAPNSALCQVLTPPTASEPVKPVERAVAQVVKVINASQEDAKSAGSGSSGSSSSGKASGPVKTDDKKEEKKEDKKDDKSAQSGTKETTNEKPAAKSYCN